MVQSLYSPLTDSELWRRYHELVHVAGEELAAGNVYDATLALEEARAIDQAIFRRHLK